VILVLWCGFRILKWTAIEMRAIDRKVGKVLTKGKFYHSKSNVHRLYISRQRGEGGGRGLIGAIDYHQQECTALTQYLADSKDLLCLVIHKTSVKRNSPRYTAWSRSSYPWRKEQRSQYMWDMRKGWERWNFTETILKDKTQSPLLNYHYQEDGLTSYTSDLTMRFFMCRPRVSTDYQLYTNRYLGNRKFKYIPPM